MRALVVGVVVAGVMAVGVLPAFAHEDEESAKAGDLVRQAIAFIVNTPKDRMAIDDKVNDALDSTQTEGVDLDLVRQAKTALDDGDLHRTRTLLEESIGAQPHLSSAADVLPVGQTHHGPLATGSETGVNVTTDALEPRRHFDAGTWAALGAMAALVLAGVLLAVRYRPPVSLREMRASAKAAA